MVSAGFRSGKMVAVAPIGVRGRHMCWIVRCDCGNTKRMREYDLRIGRIKSCGCTAVRDLTGQRFGKVLVIEPAGIYMRMMYWIVRCDCGNVKDIRGSSLVSGRSKSCGCGRGSQMAMRGG